MSRPGAGNGPIAWGKVVRTDGHKARQGVGRSGRVYHVEQGRAGWQVSIDARRGSLEIGSARMQDHALALAGMWELGILSGRIDMS